MAGVADSAASTGLTVTCSRSRSKNHRLRAVAHHELARAAGAGGTAGCRTARGSRLRMDVPAELARPRHDQRAGGAVDLAAVRVGEGLQEAGAQRLEVVQVGIERRRRTRRARRQAQQCRQQRECRPAYRALRLSACQSSGARAPALRARRWPAADRRGRPLHRLEQPRGAVVADLQPALHVGDGRLALGGDDLAPPRRRARSCFGIPPAPPALALLARQGPGSASSVPTAPPRCSSAASDVLSASPRDALPGPRRRRRARASAARCPAAGTACRRGRAASRRPSGRGWCASRPSPRPGRRCGRECWP